MAMGKEAQADELASDILLPVASERAVVSRGIKDLADVERYAREFNTHPSVIMSRLHCSLFLRYDADNDMFPIVNLFPELEL